MRDPGRREEEAARADAVLLALDVHEQLALEHVPVEQARETARAIPGARLLVVEGGGHRPDIRDPVAINLELDRFLGEGGRPRERRVARAAARAGRRALYVSSPIGLGHVRRDLAIATELRARCPDLEIEWLAQPPAAGVLEAAPRRTWQPTWCAGRCTSRLGSARPGGGQEGEAEGAGGGYRGVVRGARDSEGAAVHAAIRYCFERQHLRRTLTIALVVGCVLTLINQLDVFLRGDATTLTYVKSVLNFCVPFVVSNLGLLAGRRREVAAAVDELPDSATDAVGPRDTESG